MGLTMEKLARDLKLDIVVEGKANTEIDVNDISRPGLQFAGYYDYFAYSRIQILGKVEWSYLETLDADVRKERLKKFFEFDIPCIIIARGLDPHPELLKFAREKKVWVLKCNCITTRLVNKLINYFDRELAKKTTMHGVLMDVYGVGILITGESGIGKSETALELLKRGHILISDDAVDIKRIDGILYGTSPYITAGMMEVRGLGIIDVSALYGLSSVAEEKTVNLVVQLEQWRDDKDYDRLGVDSETIDILGIPVKRIVLPIRPGRNIAVIIEAAAANYRYGLRTKVSPVETIDKRIDEILKR
ncbi:HPr(Ser) kinase/phosphatase [Fonticella tunisiensis]|uniref:HPr kinase/phosphorylase n=1 Tax=Fonticella tunisiensis TaxID=1096341 RepID=A0A4R7KKZ1_9CLOT|nr:HPr(Ser) kinase/phosphatase [Fonticella tunisiensis]TDT56521.1 Hpr(Ser) kinase/phosphatase [Fonticella tunisiensis]